MRHFTWIDFIVSPLETKPPNLIIFQLHPNLLLSNAIKSVLILKCLNVDVDSTNSTFKSVKDKKNKKSKFSPSLRRLTKSKPQHTWHSHHPHFITALRNARIASAVLAMAFPSVCLSDRPSVRPSVTRRYCVKTTARSTVQFALPDSKMRLVLQKPKSVPRGRPLPLKSWLQVTCPL